MAQLTSPGINTISSSDLTCFFQFSLILSQWFSQCCPNISMGLSTEPDKCRSPIAKIETLILPAVCPFPLFFQKSDYSILRETKKHRPQIWLYTQPGC